MAAGAPVTLTISSTTMLKLNDLLEIGGSDVPVPEDSKEETGTPVLQRKLTQGPKEEPMDLANTFIMKYSLERNNLASHNYCLCYLAGISLTCLADYKKDPKKFNTFVRDVSEILTEERLQHDDEYEMVAVLREPTAWMTGGTYGYQTLHLYIPEGFESGKLKFIIASEPNGYRLIADKWLDTRPIYKIFTETFTKAELNAIAFESMRSGYHSAKTTTFRGVKFYNIQRFEQAFGVKDYRFQIMEDNPNVHADLMHRSGYSAPGGYSSLPAHMIARANGVHVYDTRTGYSRYD